MPGLITVLNGPNLNLLGTRQREIYGAETLADIEAACRSVLAEGFELRFSQSNAEGQLVSWIQEARDTSCGLVINPAAYSHTSIAILDALQTFDGPVIEVHISNIHRRESFRKNSFVSLRADAVIAGLAGDGYVAAVRRIQTLVGGA